MGGKAIQNKLLGEAMNKYLWNILYIFKEKPKTLSEIVLKEARCRGIPYKISNIIKTNPLDYKGLPKR